MQKINLALIGTGNVIRTRHFPALLKNKNLFNIVGVLDSDENSAANFAKKHRITNHSILKSEKDLMKIDWFERVDAVIIGIPPQKHYGVAKECLFLKKHVLVEKPFTVTVKQAKELVNLAKRKHLILAVKHNFQYTTSFLKLEELIRSKDLGRMRSIYCVQLTNQSRRIPTWTEELPIGLFYDESPHYFYLARKFTGHDITIKTVYQSKSKIRKSTPEIINLNLESNGIPITIYWNFDSPICEWYFTVFGEKKSATVDLFRDILIVLPNDTPHLGFQVMRTSIFATLQHWKGIFLNGFSYIQNKLYYGFDIAQENFYKAIINGDTKFINGMSGEDGLYVTKIQNKIVTELNKQNE